MNKTIAMKWVKALRSGKYKQGQGALCEVTTKGTKHCCLGVLTDLYQKECKRKKKKALTVKKFYALIDDNTMTESYVEAYGSTKETEILPLKVKKWARMCSRRGDIETDVYCGLDLIEMNDDGVSFKKIASVIEKNYEAL